MIIVNQNKKIILNFDNVPIIAINDKENSKEIYALTNGETVVSLGIYATEERTNEVLQEIILTYTGEAMVEYNGYISFEMPEE